MDPACIRNAQLIMDGWDQDVKRFLFFYLNSRMPLQLALDQQGTLLEMQYHFLAFIYVLGCGIIMYYIYKILFI